MKRFKLYTTRYWRDFAWESMNPSRHIEWEVKRCDHGDPHPPPRPDEDVFYTSSELEHAKRHRCRSKTAFMLEVRPAVPEFYEYLKSNADVFDRVLTHDVELCRELGSKAVFFPHGNCCVLRRHHGLHPKERLLSSIASAKRFMPGHDLRHAIYERARRSRGRGPRRTLAGKPIDLYGPLAGRYLPYKLGALKRYAFHIAIENCVHDTYFTEKLIDCFVTGTIPIYYGTRGIESFFNMEGVLRIDTLDELFDILEALSFDLYASKRAAVADNFKRAQSYLLAEDWIAENTNIFGPPSPASATAPVRPEVGPPGEPVWTPPPLLPSRSHREAEPESPPEGLLKAVTDTPKTTVHRVEDVPRAIITWSPVTSRTVPPKTTDGRARPWYPEQTRGFMLSVPDAFIGDNVVFDRERYYSLGRWWLGRSWELYRNTKEVRRLDVAISIAAWGGEAFQHFVIDALPRLAAVLDQLETPALEHIQIVTHHNQALVAKWFFHELGLEHRLVQKPRSAREGFVYHAQTALYFDFEPVATEGVYPRGILEPVQRRLGIFEPGPEDLVIYLARPPATKRSVANEDRLLAELRPWIESWGYTLHVFDQHHDLHSDRELFKRARLVLGPHGGAFANLIFVRPGTPVIEFAPLYTMYANGEAPRPIYWGLAQAAGLDYWVVEPRNFHFDRPGMVVDVEEVIDIVRRALGGPGAPIISAAPLDSIECKMANLAADIRCALEDEEGGAWSAVAAHNGLMDVVSTTRGSRERTDLARLFVDDVAGALAAAGAPAIALDADTLERQAAGDAACPTLSPLRIFLREMDVPRATAQLEAIGLSRVATPTGCVLQRLQERVQLFWTLDHLSRGLDLSIEALFARALPIRGLPGILKRLEPVHAIIVAGLSALDTGGGGVPDEQAPSRLRWRALYDLCVALRMRGEDVRADRLRGDATRLGIDSQLVDAIAFGQSMMRDWTVPVAFRDSLALPADRVPARARERLDRPRWTLVPRRFPSYRGHLLYPDRAPRLRCFSWSPDGFELGLTERTLNRPSVAIVQACDGRRSEANIIEMVAARFEVDADVIESDVTQALRSLERAGLIRAAGSRQDTDAIELCLVDRAGRFNAGDRRWGESRFVRWRPIDAPTEEAMNFLVFDQFDVEAVHQYQAQRKIAWMREPRQMAESIYEALEDRMEHFDAVLTHDESLMERHPDKCVYYPGGASRLASEQFRVYEKTKLVSAVAPEAGTWFESLRDYRFHVAIESTKTENCFTYRLLDCFLTGTIPIYRGASRATDFFDAEGILVHRTDQELHAVLAGLNPPTYDQRLGSVRRNFELAHRYVSTVDWVFEHTTALRPSLELASATDPRSDGSAEG